MSEVPEEWQFLKTAWRFALVLTGCREGAGKVIKETATEVASHPQPGDLNRTRHLFYTALRRRALKYPARNELTGTVGKFHTVSEPARSALALLYLDALSPGEIAKILELDQRGLADTLDRARTEVSK